MSETGEILFDDYATAAFVWSKACMARFIEPNRFLAKFDIAPFAAAALPHGGGIDTAQVAPRPWGGGAPVWEGLPEWKGPEELIQLFSNTRGTVNPPDTNEIEMAVMMAMFCDAHLTGKFADFMEPRIKPIDYLKKLGIWDGYWQPFEKAHPGASRPLTKTSISAMSASSSRRSPTCGSGSSFMDALRRSALLAPP